MAEQFRSPAWPVNPYADLFGAAQSPAPPSAPPVPASAPPPSPAGGQPMSGQRGGGVGSFLSQYGPMIGSVIAMLKAGDPGSRGAFLQAFAQTKQQLDRQNQQREMFEQQQARLQAETAAAERWRREQRAQEYVTSARARIENATTPEEYYPAVDAAEFNAPQFGLPRGYFRQQYGPFPDAKLNALAAKDAQTILDNLKKTVENQAQLADMLQKAAIEPENAPQESRIMVRNPRTGKDMRLRDVVLILGAKNYTPEPEAGGDASYQAKNVTGVVGGKPWTGMANFNPKTGKYQTPEGDIVTKVRDAPAAASPMQGERASDAKAIADAVIAGAQPPDLTRLYGIAGPLRAELARRGYDLTSAQLDWQAVTRWVANANATQQLRMRQAAQTAYDSLDVIEDLAEQWRGGNFPLLNKGRLMAAKQGALGEKAQAIATTLQAQITDVVSELGNVYMGGNSPTDHALDLAARNLSADWSLPQLKAAIDLARTNLQIRLNSVRTAGPVGARGDNPYWQAPGGEQTVTMAELEELAASRGTTVEEEKRRATAAGYIIR